MKTISGFLKVLLILALILPCTKITAQEAVSGIASPLLHRNNSMLTSNPKGKSAITLEEQLSVFYPLHAADEYLVTVCADLPVNNDATCVYRKGEPGHVFFILSKRNTVTGQMITSSFGFYPRLAVSCLVKKVRSKILDNSCREYNASIEMTLNRSGFEFLLAQCRELSKRKYHLKKFNCYDYVVQIFNSLPGIEKLPVTRVKFPFILGRGGSPCGLYKDLKQLASSGSPWAPFIKFGTFFSPMRGQSEKRLASF
jgi:hypothetical protein